LDYLVTEKKLSHAKACRILKLSRNGRYYQKRLPAKDAIVKQAIEKVLPGCRKGRRKVIILVKKSHPEIGSSRIRRVYTQGGFSLFKRPSGRKVKAKANPLPVCLEAHQEWAIDYMSDALTDKRRFRVLNIIDHYSRYCIASHAGHSIPARRLIEYLEQAIQLYKKPLRIRTDNGPEFTSKRFQLWLKKHGIEWQQIEPGCPQQNACVERFNRTLREDALDANLFNSITHAQEIIDDIRKEYNEVRPHESINDQAPMTLMAA
jgi:putative transposase